MQQFMDSDSDQSHLCSTWVCRPQKMYLGYIDLSEKQINNITNVLYLNLLLKAFPKFNKDNFDNKCSPYPRSYFSFDIVISHSFLVGTASQDLIRAMIFLLFQSYLKCCHFFRSYFISLHSPLGITAQLIYMVLNQIYVSNPHSFSELHFFLSCPLPIKPT